MQEAARLDHDEALAATSPTSLPVYPLFYRGITALLRSEHPNHARSYDFVEGRTNGGGKFRMLNGIDEFTMECLAIKIDHKLRSTAPSTRSRSYSWGEAFKGFRGTDEWAKKAPRTREDWWRAWTLIKPAFGDVRPSRVTLVTISAFRSMVERKVSLREEHRAIKIWRALWKVAAAIGYCVRDADPSMGVRNSAAKGRKETWLEGEAVRLVKRAWRIGFFGLSAVIAAAWDTQLNPGDIRLLTASRLAMAGHGELFFPERGKTGKPVGGALRRRLAFVLQAYLTQLGVELHGDAPVFRNRSGQPYSKDTLGDDFRDVRRAEFGKDERRTLSHDFRRSGAVEAIVGGGTAEALSHAMGNTLSASNTLFATYVPVNAETIRSVTEARRRGRAKLR